jgi:hypothetical protein
MSRGLGLMQRTVLECLAPAKAAHARGELVYEGSNRAINGLDRMYDSVYVPTVTYRGKQWTLADEIYDLRAVLKYCAITDRKAYQIDTGTWEVYSEYRIAFYRAVRSLIRRGELHPVMPDDDRREIRFVARLPKPEPDHTGNLSSIVDAAV